MPLVTIGGKKMTLVVLRPGAVLKLGRGDGVKVIHGMFISSHIREAADSLHRLDHDAGA